MGDPKPEFKSGFRASMSSSELAQELHIVMTEFRPLVSEIAANSLRWEFCLLHGFPFGNEAAPSSHAWCMHVRDEPMGSALSTHFGSSPAEAVDKAMRWRP